jgi:hypothetical protein
MNHERFVSNNCPTMIVESRRNHAMFLIAWTITFHQRYAIALTICK